MNKPLVLERVYQLTEQDGGMAIIAEGSPVRGARKIEPWKMKRKELIIKYLGPERRAGDKLHKDFIPEKSRIEDFITAPPFSTYERKLYPYETKRSIDEIIGFLYSTSYANKELLGSHAGAFEAEMRTELLALVPSGVFVESGETELFLLRKP